MLNKNTFQPPKKKKKRQEKMLELKIFSGQNIDETWFFSNFKLTLVK